MLCGQIFDPRQANASPRCVALEGLQAVQAVQAVQAAAGGAGSILLLMFRKGEAFVLTHRDIDRQARVCFMNLLSNDKFSIEF